MSFRFRNDSGSGEWSGGFGRDGLSTPFFMGMGEESRYVSYFTHSGASDAIYCSLFGFSREKRESRAKQGSPYSLFFGFYDSETPEVCRRFLKKRGIPAPKKA